MPITPLDLAHFKVIIPPSTSSMSFSELRISDKKLFFNYIAVTELGYPENVCLLLSEDNSQLVVGGSEPTQYTLPFYSPSYNSSSGSILRKATCVGHDALVKAIRKELKWGSRGTYRTAGMRIPNSPYLVFDLFAAETGKRTKREPVNESFLERCPSLIEIEHNYHPILAIPNIASEVVEVVAS